METLTFMAGLVIGLGIMAYTRRCEHMAVEDERRRACQNARDEHIRTDNLARDLSITRDQRDTYRARLDTNRAYQDGYQAGRTDPLNDAEHLVRSFGGRNVKIVDRTKEA